MLDASRRMFYELAKKQHAHKRDRVTIYVRSYMCTMVEFFTGSEKFYDSLR